MMITKKLYFLVFFHFENKNKFSTICWIFGVKYLGYEFSGKWEVEESYGGLDRLNTRFPGSLRYYTNLIMCRIQSLCNDKKESKLYLIKLLFCKYIKYVWDGERKAR